MRLKLFVILISVLYALVLCCGIVAYRLAVVYPQLKEHTLKSQQSDLLALSTAFKAEEDHLRLLLVDWAKWDDSYRFVQNPTSAYIQSNLVAATFFDAKLSAVLYADLNRNLILGKQYDVTLDTVLDLSAGSDEFHTFKGLTEKQLEGTSCGYTNLDTTTSLYCVTSIQDSNEAKPSNGYLVFYRELGASFYSKLQQVTNTRFTLASRKQTKGMDVQMIHSRKPLVTPKSEYARALLDNDQKPVSYLLVQYDPQSLPVPIDAQTWSALITLCTLPILLALLVFKLVVHPVGHMSATVLAHREDKDVENFETPHFIHEIAIFQQALNSLFEKVRLEHKQLRIASMTDGLTGIKNRRAFDIRIQNIWRLGARLQTPIALILVDIDNFKALNDTLGHSKGDQALQAVALALRGTCRRSTDRIYRYGGEEFALTLLLENQDHVASMLDTIHQSISQLRIHHPLSEVSEFITVSAGAAMVMEPGAWMADEEPQRLIELADKALYEAKDLGKNRSVSYYLEHS